MMKKIFYRSLILPLFISVIYGQEQGIRRDSSSMPKLEIPEITIVGKKAITLPFARKGEIYDVDLFEPDPPDTSVLDRRPPISLPIGELPRYDEPVEPWHFSAKGSFGSFSAGGGRAYVDYSGRGWGIYGNGGLRSTGGHAPNSSGSEGDAEVSVRSVIATDNEILRSFRGTGRIKYGRDSYGMFGIHGAVPDRSRSNFIVDAHLGSLNRLKNAVTLGITADILSVSDKGPAADSRITTASPEIYASYYTDAGKIRFTTGTSFRSSSLNYTHATESPSLLEITASGQLEIMQNWSLTVGGGYYSGSGSDGVDNYLLLPFAHLKWVLDRDRTLSFWYRPGMHLDSYADLSLRNPYLIREIRIRPERVPLFLGGTFWFNSELFSIEIEGSLSHSEDKNITVADSGRISLDYVDANMFKVSADGSLKPADNLKVTFTGVLRTVFEEGESSQLPMVPLLQLGGRGEYAFGFPVILWSSVEYRSRQDADRAGKESVDAYFLLGAGASTTIVPRTVLSLSVSNILDTRYEWWDGYEGPGIAVALEAKVNIR